MQRPIGCLPGCVAPEENVHHLRCPNHPQAAALAEALSENPPSRAEINKVNKEQFLAHGATKRAAEYDLSPANSLRDFLDRELGPEEERKLYEQFERERAGSRGWFGGALSGGQQLLILLASLAFGLYRSPFAPQLYELMAGSLGSMFTLDVHGDGDVDVDD